MVLALAGCTGGSNNSTAPATNTTPPTSSSVVQPEIYAQRKVDLASLNQAIEQYHVAEGHYPANLQDLTPTYLAKIPQVPAGYKINYNAVSGAVSLVRQ